MFFLLSSSYSVVGIIRGGWGKKWATFAIFLQKGIDFLLVVCYYMTIDQLDTD